MLAKNPTCYRVERHGQEIATVELLDIETVELLDMAPLELLDIGISEAVELLDIGTAETVFRL